jgi:hypothetical protein
MLQLIHPSEACSFYTFWEFSIIPHGANNVSISGTKHVNKFEAGVPIIQIKPIVFI